MNLNGQSENAQTPNKSFPNVFTNPVNSIPIYTVLCILRKMKNQLGLESMLEYHAKYLETIETHNPELKQAVEKAIGLMSMDKMYKDVMK